MMDIIFRILVIFARFLKEYLFWKPRIDEIVTHLDELDDD